MSRLVRFMSFVWGGVLVLVATAGYAEKLPVSYFASLPDVSHVILSPDGESVASLQRVDVQGIKGTSLNVVDLATGKSTLLLFVDNEEQRIRWIRWANDKKILVGTAFPGVRYETPTTETRLLIVDVETKKNRSAVNGKFLSTLYDYPQIQDFVVDILPNDNDHFLLHLNSGTSLNERVYKISLTKSEMKLVHGSKSNIVEWITDRYNNVRVGRYFYGTTNKFIHRPIGSKKWTTLWEFESFTEDKVWPIGFGENPNILYVSALHNGRDAVFKVDLSDSDLNKELVYANSKYDVSGSLVYSKLTKKVVGISLSDDQGYVFWDKEYKKLMAGINKALPGSDNSLVSMSDDERKYVVYVADDSDPGAYYLGDRDKNTLDPIAERYAKLDPKVLAEKRKVHYKARDGLDIEAFLTLPKSYVKGEKLPTIIFPHGGPISYGGSGFDYWTQFFANRGFAVFQMDFRGSSGYGFDFMKAGMQNWGLAMQDDVEDGTKWMINNGYTDANKICIVGGSYGGYAALMGAVKTPDLYQCAVSFAGVTDIAYLLLLSRSYVEYDITKAQIGSDSSALRKRSPLHNVESINIPILLIHGEEDRVVKVKHSRKMRSKLKRKKKDVTYLELEKGTHYLSNNDNRVAAFKAMDEFLQKHLID